MTDRARPVVAPPMLASRSQQPRKPQPQQTGIADLQKRSPSHRGAAAQIGTALAHLGLPKPSRPHSSEPRLIFVPMN